MKKDDDESVEIDKKAIKAQRSEGASPHDIEKGELNQAFEKSWKREEFQKLAVIFKNAGVSTCLFVHVYKSLGNADLKD